MAHRETDIDHLTTLLGQCLGRIDEQAYRLQRSRDDDDFATGDVLERETALLQELVSSVLQQTAQCDDADLNRVVEHALRSTVAEVDVPIVVRTRLDPRLPRIACAPGQLSYAVQRALALVLGDAAAGSEITVITRREEGAVLLEIESRDTAPGAHFAERSSTLGEFVTGLGGSCRCAADDRGASLVAMQLPAALVLD
jgi:hypothetical protein